MSFESLREWDSSLSGASLTPGILGFSTGASMDDEETFTRAPELTRNDDIASQPAPHVDRLRMELLIKKLASPFSPFAPRRITIETASSAIVLGKLLPRSAPLPKIAAEDDGALLLVWETMESAVLATIAGNVLHLVTGAGTVSAEYFDEIPIRQDELPDELAKALAAL